MGKKSLVKIALGQFKLHEGDTKANLDKMLEMIDKAAEEGVDLIAFPELAYTGYFLDAHTLQKLAEPQDGPFVQQMQKKAKEKRIHILAGYAEAGKITGKMYNSCIFIDDEGNVIENMRKVYVWGEEKLKFCEGERFPVVQTKLGRIGLQICADCEYAEPSRIEMLKGADMIIDCAVWGQRAAHRWEVFLPANALFNLLFFAGVTPVGENLCGMSMIVGPDGVIRAKASAVEEELLIQEIDMDEVLETRSSIPYINDFKEKTFSMEAVEKY